MNDERLHTERNRKIKKNIDILIREREEYIKLKKKYEPTTESGWIEIAALKLRIRLLEKKLDIHIKSAFQHQGE